MEVLMRQRVFSLLVENEAGVLSRIAGLFSRRGYNIDSLTVGVTELQVRMMSLTRLRSSFRSLLM